MMISPGVYAEQLKDKSYRELLQERDELLAYIRTFEENGKKGDRTGKEWQRMPSPDVQYQMDLEYLAAVCLVLAEKYREERE